MEENRSILRFRESQKNDFHVKCPFCRAQVNYLEDGFFANVDPCDHVAFMWPVSFGDFQYTSSEFDKRVDIDELEGFRDMSLQEKLEKAVLNGGYTDDFLLCNTYGEYKQTDIWGFTPSPEWCYE